MKRWHQASAIYIGGIVFVICDLLRNFESFLPDEARIMRVSNFCENDSSSMLRA